MALSHGKRIFPVLPRKDSEFPYLLRHISYLDLSEEAERPEKIRRLAKAIATSSPDSPEQPQAQLARSEAIVVLAKELKAETREYQHQSARRDWTLATGSIAVLVSTVTLVAVLLYGLDSEATSKSFYIALGVMASLVARTVSSAVVCLFARRLEKTLGVGHE